MIIRTRPSDPAAKYVELAKASGARIRAVYLNCPVESALCRGMLCETENKEFPVSAVRFYNKILRPPTVEEGFDSVEEIHVDYSTAFHYFFIKFASLYFSGTLPSDFRRS